MDFRGIPEILIVDHGPEFRSASLEGCIRRLVPAEQDLPAAGRLQNGGESDDGED